MFQQHSATVSVSRTVRPVHTGTESEEEAQVLSSGQQAIDSHRHSPVSLVDELAAEVVVYLARDYDIGRRCGAGGRRRLVFDGRKQRGVEVAAVVLADEVVSRVQRHKTFVDGQQRS